MSPQLGLQLLLRAVHRVAVDGGGDRVELLPGAQAAVSSEVNTTIRSDWAGQAGRTNLTPASTLTKFMQVFLWREKNLSVSAILIGRQLGWSCPPSQHSGVLPV